MGYLIIYTTGRPDMQQQKVVSWLSQHNFPHGLVSFADGLSTDPLGHKAAYLNNLVQVCYIREFYCYISLNIYILFLESWCQHTCSIW
jgi:hypothetical protein